MGLFKRKKKKPSAEYSWKVYDYADTVVQRDRKIKKLKKDGFDVRWTKVKNGRNAGSWVIQTRLKK